jgi:two-component system, NarL family, nitrate/nitrite response regulator NarL
MKLLIFTPIRLFGEALATALGEFDEIEVVGVCHATDRVADRVLELGPDLVLFDVTGEQSLGEARCVARACPTLRMIALALPEVPKEVIACADAGFTAYVPRQASIDELRGLMRMALRGEASCHPRVVACLFNELRQRCGLDEPNASEPLTKRESDVLRLVGRGSSNKEVARTLNVSVSTVKAHMHSVLTKLRVRGRGQAIARLRNEPWLERSA